MNKPLATELLNHDKRKTSNNLLDKFLQYLLSNKIDENLQLKFQDFYINKSVLKFWFPSYLHSIFMQFINLNDTENLVLGLKNNNTKVQKLSKIKGLFIYKNIDYLQQDILDKISFLKKVNLFNNFKKGTYFSNGDTLYIWLECWSNPLRLEFWGNKLEEIILLNLDFNTIKRLNSFFIPEKSISKNLDIFVNVNFGNFKESAQKLIQEPNYFPITKIYLQSVNAYQKISPIYEFAHYEGAMSFNVRKNLLYNVIKKYYINQNYSFKNRKTSNENSLTSNLKSKIYLVTSNEDKLKKILDKNIIKDCTIVNSLFIKSGFVCDQTNGQDGNQEVNSNIVEQSKNPLNSILVLTEKELFGTVDVSSQNSLWLNNLKKFKIGDYLVHQDHGIGKYVGLKQLVPDKMLYDLVKQYLPEYKKGDPIDYLYIKYANNERLLIPIFQSSKLTKYIASGSLKPKLTTLNGSNWNKIKKKVEKSTQELSMQLLRIYALRQNKKLNPIDFDQNLFDSFVKDFEYKDTPDQTIVTKEILDDLRKDQPMDRLLVGDVGFGKTEIAIRTAFAIVNNISNMSGSGKSNNKDLKDLPKGVNTDNPETSNFGGCQVAVLAPTTILTQQHFIVFKHRLEKYNIRVEVLNRFIKKSKQYQIIDDLKNGKIDIIIGTHRLLSNDIKFKNLGLVIVDEEQNFGVKQKEKLKSLRLDLHILSMSATPIPRTLHFSLMGIRTLSVMSTPPLGRKQVQIKKSKFNWSTMLNAIEKELNDGGQVMLLYNRVATIQNFYEKLKSKITEIGYNYSIDFAHGRLIPQLLSKKIDKFYHKQTQILIATTIIQNGIDIPNANTLIIINAQKLGLAQLYQLKGRVGRSTKQAYVYLFIGDQNTLQSGLQQSDLPKEEKFKNKNLTENSQKRLEAIMNNNTIGSGFSIASADLAIRGVGNILGKEQHGFVNAIGFGLYQQMLDKAIRELE